MACAIAELKYGDWQRWSYSCQPRPVNRTARIVICMSRLRLASILRVATPSWTGLGIWVIREALQAVHESPWVRPLQIFQLNSIRLPGAPLASTALTISVYDTLFFSASSSGPARAATAIAAILSSRSLVTYRR